MHVIMTDEEHKCRNYQKQREHTVKGWHKIELAPSDAVVWRQKSANRETGYITKNGWNPHT